MQVKNKPSVGTQHMRFFWLTGLEGSENFHHFQNYLPYLLNISKKQLNKQLTINT